jgi:hypothetical protein
VGELRFHPGRDTVLAGGRLGIGAAWNRWLAAVDLHGATASPAKDLGEIEVRLLGFGLTVGPRFSMGPLRTEMGPSLEIGWGWVHGRSGRPDVRVGSGGGFIVSAGGRVGIEAPAGAALRVRAHLEAGAALRGVTGDVNGAPAAGATGGYLLIGVGAAFLGRRAP